MLCNVAKCLTAVQFLDVYIRAPVCLESCTVIMLMKQAGGFEWIYVTSQWVNDQKQWQVCFLDVAA